MSVLTDRELRDELRQDGIKVTSDLTSRQREMMEFYRNQGQAVYYRNGRLHFVNKFQQPNSRTQFDRYDNRHTDHFRNTNTGVEQTLYDEDWPYLPRFRENRHESGYDFRQGQNRPEDQWKNNRNNWTAGPSDRNIRGRQQLQNEHRGDFDEYRQSYSSHPDHGERAQTQSRTTDSSQRGSQHDDRNEERNKEEPSGQYRTRRGLNRDPPGETAGGRHVAPGHRTYQEALQSRPQPANRSEQQRNKPPINKTWGRDARPRLYSNRADERNIRHRQNQVDKQTDATLTIVRHVQMENVPEQNQKTVTNDTGTEYVTDQSRDDESNVHGNPQNNNDVIHVTQDCDSVTRDDTITHDNNGEVTEQPTQGDETDRQSGKEKGPGGQEESGQDEVIDRTITGLDAPTDDLPVSTGAVKQNNTVDTHCDDQDTRAEILKDCEQNRQSHTTKGAARCGHTHTQGTSSPASSSNMQDRSARNRQKSSTQAQHADCTPQASRPRSGSQATIVDTLRRMRSKERSKEGGQEKQGAGRTRSQSVQNK